MRRERGRDGHRSVGFSLVEVIVVMALLSLAAGALAPFGLQQVDASRRRATDAKLESLVEGLLGDPSSGYYGYVGSIGALPGSLVELNDAAGQPPYVVDPNDGVGYGFAGPYAPRVAPPSTVPVDSWGTPIAYTPGVAQVSSAGPDRSLGTADDVTRPLAAPVTTGTVVVTVRGFVGGTEVPMSPATVQVTVGSAVAGIRDDQPTSGSNPFLRTGVHAGYHGITATGVGPDFGGIVVRDVVEVRVGNALSPLILVAP